MNIIRKMKWALPLAILIALVSVTVSLAKVTFIIDHFDTFQTLLLTWAGTPVSDSNGLLDSSVLGGERDIVGHIEVGQGGETLEITSNNASNSLFRIASGNHVASWSELQYDGSQDSPKSDINYTGLNSFDLTAHGDRFVITVVFDDVPADIIVTAFTDANNWSDYSEFLSGSISITNPYIMEIPFTWFSDRGSSGGVDWTDLGALTIRVDAMDFPTSLGLDLTIHFIAVANGPFMDFGDLPDQPPPNKYNYDTLLPTGARNVVSLDSVLLGPGVSVEVDGQANIPANGDSFDDGVVRTPGVSWTQAVNGGSVDISVTQCPNQNCYVSAWIDWNQDGDFGSGPPWDTGELILSDHAVSNGANNNITFDVPVSVNDQEFYTRFRIYTNPIAPFNLPYYAMLTGETEDYLWAFGPTAIELTSVEARPNYELPFGLLAGVLVLLVSGGLLLAYKRHRA